MSGYVPYPWRLACPWCDYYIVVNPRGMSGNDMGSGVEAAHMMEVHVGAQHNHTWREFLGATS